MVAQNSAAACIFLCSSLASRSYVFRRLISLWNCDSDEYLGAIGFSGFVFELPLVGVRGLVVFESTVTYLQGFAVLGVVSLPLSCRGIL